MFYEWIQTGGYSGLEEKVEWNKFTNFLFFLYFAEMIIKKIILNTKSGVNKKNRIGFHPATTLFFSETQDTIIKSESGFWKKDKT